MEETAKMSAFKEGMRYVLFLIISWIITGALSYLDAIPETQVTLVLVFVLRVVDKYLYKSGIAEGGLSRF